MALWQTQTELVRGSFSRAAAHPSNSFRQRSDIPIPQRLRVKKKHFFLEEALLLLPAKLGER